MNPLTLLQIQDLMGNPSTTSQLGSQVISGICVDSRLLLPNQLFFALKGAKSDGHSFLHEAIARGACAAVVSKESQVQSNEIPLIHVDDPLSALQTLAKNVLESRETKVVAVTGSLGKTTTKEFITTLLSQKYHVVGSPGNSNSQIGLPLAILNHSRGNEEYLILEMGMTHPGQLKNLIQIAPPDIAVITTVELVHACNFDSLQDIVKAKSEILGHPKTRFGIIPRDVEGFQAMSQSGFCKKISFSVKNSNADYYLELHNNKVQIVAPDGTVVLTAPKIPGKHNLHNFLAAVAVARSLNLSWEEIQDGIPVLALPEKRMQQVDMKGIIFINDSYNASAVSMKAALESLPQPKHGGKKIAVLGEMRELGKFSDSCHREVGEAALKHVDQVLCFNSGCKPIVDIWEDAKRPVGLYTDFEELVTALKGTVKAGDVVLLKGSNGNGLWRLLPALEMEEG